MPGYSDDATNQEENISVPTTNNRKNHPARLPGQRQPTRGGRYISRNIVGHQYRGFFGISLYIYCISTTSAVRFLDGVVLVACSMAALSLTLYC